MKFFFTFIFSALFCLFFKAEGVPMSHDLHPYHVGSLELRYNSTTQTFEITGKFFMDDLENAINKKFGTNLQFLNKKESSKMNQFLEKYMSEYLKLKTNGNLVKVSYLGFEEESESVNIYLETEKISQPGKVEVSASILYNLFDDQMNIIHIIVNGKRQSHKLNYPDRYLYKVF